MLYGRHACITTIHNAQDIKHSERIAAKQALPELHALLRKELIAEGIDPDNVGGVGQGTAGEGDQERPFQ